MNINHLAIHTHDVEGTLAFYEAIGLKSFLHSEGYARLRCPAGETTLSLIGIADRAPGTGNLTVYIETEDVPAQVERLKATGHAFEHECLTQPWGWDEARLCDPAGNLVCLFRAGDRRFSA